MLRKPRTDRPSAILLVGTPGAGKTTIAAYADDSVILMARGELGYETLVKHGRAPERMCAELNSWSQTLDMLYGLADTPGSAKLVALDALGGFEQMCHQHVTHQHYDGKDTKFTAYNKGYVTAGIEWTKLLVALDKCRAAGMAVLLIAHSVVVNTPNPDGEDFKSYAAACHPTTYGLTGGWVDAVLFLNFVTTTKTEGGKSKGVGGTQRVLYCERRATLDAKNRFGMPESIDMPDDPAQMWATMAAAIKGGA